MTEPVPRVPFRWLAAAVVGVLLAIGLGLWLGGWRFHTHYSGQTDLGSYFLPKYKYAAERIAAGELPTWNPFEFGGIPFLATIQAAVFYPPVRLAWAVLSGEQAYALLLTLHLLIGALGGALLARDLGLGFWPCVFAGAWVTHPIWYVRIYDHPVFSMPTSWIPLLIVLSRRLIRTPSGRGAALLAIVGTLQALAGYPPLVLATAYVLLLGMPFWLVECGGDGTPVRPLPILASLSGALLLAVLLGAAQLVPTLHLALLTDRAADAAVMQARLAELSAKSDDVLLFLGIPLPTFSGALHALWDRSGPFLLVPGLLALVLRPRSPATWFAFAMLVFTACLPSWAYTVLPLHGLVRFGFEWLFIASIATYLLAAIGLDALLQPVGVRLRAGLTVAILAAATATNFIALDRRWLELDLGKAPPLPDVSSICDLHDPLYRAFSVVGMVRGSTMTELVRSPAGYEQSLLPSRVAQLQRRLGIGNGLVLPQWARSVADNAVLASRYGLRCVLTQPAPALAQGGFVRTPTGIADGEVYRNPAALPRLRLARDVVAAASPDEAFELVQSPPAQRVVLEGARAGDVPRDCPTSSADRVELLRDAPEEVRVATQSDCAAYLVLADTLLPGWSATVDGEPVPILQADYAFRAVRVPPGGHEIAFTYRAPGLIPGVILSLLGLVAIGLLLVRGKRRLQPAP